MSYEQFDASRLTVEPLAKRRNLLRIEDIADLLRGIEERMLAA